MIPSVFLATLAAAAAFGFIHAFVLWAYLGMSAVTFGVYAIDKSAARNRRQRTPENTLHMLSLMGGWPGAMYAQQLLRHKSSKRSFLTVFWLTFLVNIAVLAYVLSPYGAWLSLSLKL
ncbi:MAG TPA: DUF1294 domain-containing protein [Noviherbaspirillum sp.]|nr:DUF1294 domain-containing protein [Noviherbaspirillum sp.]